MLNLGANRQILIAFFLSPKNTIYCMFFKINPVYCVIGLSEAQSLKKPGKYGLKKENGNDILVSLRLNIIYLYKKRRTFLNMVRLLLMVSQVEHWQVK